MKKSDVKIGMRVVPFQKTAKNWGNLESSCVWKNAQDSGQKFLYVVGIYLNEESELVRNKVVKKTTLEYMLNSEKTHGGDFFDARDFKPYIEKKNGKPNSR